MGFLLVLKGAGYSSCYYLSLLIILGHHLCGLRIYKWFVDTQCLRVIYIIYMKCKKCEGEMLARWAGGSCKSVLGFFALAFACSRIISFVGPILSILFGLVGWLFGLAGIFAMVPQKVYACRSCGFEISR